MGLMHNVRGLIDNHRATGPYDVTEARVAIVITVTTEISVGLKRQVSFHNASVHSLR